MEVLFKHHVDAAVRLAYTITHDWSTAEDAVQEAFIQAFRSIKNFDEEKRFKPWFTRIVINKAKRVGTKFKVGAKLPDVEEENIHASFSPEETALLKESKTELYLAINQLDEKHRMPIILKYLSGLSELETASVLDIPISTVKSRLYVARQRLKSNITSSKGGEQGA